MKKIILAAIALLISTSAFSQIQFGVKGGLNLSSITKVDDYKYKPSIYLGVTAEYAFNDIFAIQPELIYSRQGAYAKVGGVKVWTRVNYLNLPIMAKLYILDNLSVDLGPQFGFNLNAKVKVKEDGVTATESVGDSFKTFDVAFGMGLTYRIIQNIDVSFRYNLGLTKVNKEGDAKAKNSVIQLGAGYRF